MIIGRLFSTSTVKTDLKKVSSKLSWSYALSWIIHYYFILNHFWNVFSLEHPRGVDYIRYLRIRISKAVTIIFPVERISLQPQRTILTLFSKNYSFLGDQRYGGGSRTAANISDGALCENSTWLSAINKYCHNELHLRCCGSLKPAITLISLVIPCKFHKHWLIYK